MRSIATVTENGCCSHRRLIQLLKFPHYSTTVCIQFLDRENNDKNNTFPLEKQICFTIVWGCAETLPFNFSADRLAMGISKLNMILKSS